MSAAPQVTRALSAPGAVARLPVPAGRAPPPALPRRLAVRLRDEWLPRAAWTVGRTGRPGLLGLALLLAAALFLLSTHLRVAAEVEALRADLAAAQGVARKAADDPAARGTATRALPVRGDLPAILRQLFSRATQARLVLDAGRYEVHATRRSDVVRYEIALPVTGPYPQVRAFIDGTLATMPAVALSGLVLTRRSIGDGDVEALIRMTVYAAGDGPGGPRGGAAAGPPEPKGTPHLATRAAEAVRSTPPDAAPGVAEALPRTERVVAPAYAGALFAQHSWYVPPPAKVLPPPPPPPPPPAPTAPPLPYAFLGSFNPDGDRPVFFLSRGDRVIDAHVGDRLDGVYQLESAAGGQLVFVYLPLDTRQILGAGAAPGASR